MDQETLYTATKWDILKLLEERDLSPIEISGMSRCSLANVSQQLRMLEMAGLVKSARTSNRDRGQPRVVYSLAQDSCYVISTANNFVEKKRLASSPSHQIVLKIWFLENQKLRTYCEKAFWRVEEHLPDITALFVDANHTSPLCLYVVSNQKLPIPEIQELRNGKESTTLAVVQLSLEELEEHSKGLFALYDPQSLFAKN